MNLTNTKPIPKTPFWHYLVAFVVLLAGMLLSGWLLVYLESVSIIEVFLGLICIYVALDMLFLQHIREKKRRNLIFDNRVLGFVDCVYFSEIINFRCTYYQIREHIEEQLSKAHQIPDNQHLIEYKAADGWHYCSHTGGHGDHMLFALLCIAIFGREYGNDDLVAWCESKMELARKGPFYYHERTPL